MSKPLNTAGLLIILFVMAASSSDADTETFERILINAPPTPPKNVTRKAVQLPSPDPAKGIAMIQDVPAYTWSFGCAPTSAAMVAAYYDRNGYPDMYTGPTNNGVMPLNNDDYWSSWVDACGRSLHRCPLAATQKGLDGRNPRGHVDDYWKCYGSTESDPYINSWPEHAAGDCLGDFMGSNQSALNNVDGATYFISLTSGNPLHASTIFNEGPDFYNKSGLCGIVEFYNSRGYNVVEAYNQKIHPTHAAGFTYTQYKAEIDAGRPVLLHVTGHTLVGVGYKDDGVTELLYIHTTWDHNVDTMTWGGNYNDHPLYMVTVVKLDPDQAVEEKDNAFLPGIYNLLFE
ncbi:MAG: hypothetical protein CSA22_01745 [Deltaproteobacteria bacterium]|nr:MAG: hypothetical protein CSA22_01745 [Deltaproteobacteria bacterium]